MGKITMYVTDREFSDSIVQLYKIMMAYIIINKLYNIY